jgi:hypothetical protein
MRRSEQRVIVRQVRLRLETRARRFPIACGLTPTRGRVAGRFDSCCYRFVRLVLTPIRLDPELSRKHAALREDMSHV